MKTASIPKPAPAARASPESLSRTLLYMSGLSIACEVRGSGFGVRGCRPEVAVRRGRRMTASLARRFPNDAADRRPDAATGEAGVSGRRSQPRTSNLEPRTALLLHRVPNHHAVRAQYLDVFLIRLDIEMRELARRTRRIHRDDCLTQKHRVQLVEQRKERARRELAFNQGFPTGVLGELREVLLALELPAFGPVRVHGRKIEIEEWIGNHSAALQALRCSIHIGIHLFVALRSGVVADDSVSEHQHGAQL